MVDRIRVNLPLGRIVQGDLYTANDTDFVTKQKRVYPAGHRLAGHPKITYFFAVAIPKNGTTHWYQTPWGKQIGDFGFAAWPVDPRIGQSAAQRDDFAWKIDDGDDTRPNKGGRINARTEGMPGCWIVSCSSTYPPKIITADFAPITEPNAVKRGFHVETVVTVDSNESQGNPGIYVNGEFVMFRAIDKEISGSIDPRSIQGFGQSALPAGLTPVGSPPAAGATPFGTPHVPSPQFPTSGAPLPSAGFGGAPGAAPPHVPAAFPAPPAAGAPMAPTPMASVASPFSAPTPMPPGVTAVPGFLPNVPNVALVVPHAFGAAPVAPGLPPTAPSGVPTPPVGPTLTAKVPPGVTYDMMRQQGWTDEMMRQQGYLA